MQRIYAIIALLTATALSVLPATAGAADDDLDVTMQVIDDLSEIDRDLVVGMARLSSPDENAYEEDASDTDADERRLVDQFIEMDGDLGISNEDDGFEHDDEARQDSAAFVAEDNFEEGEDVDDDRYDEIDDPDGNSN